MGLAGTTPRRSSPRGQPGVPGLSADFPGHHGQRGGLYHESALTPGKTRGCNFKCVILRRHRGAGERTGCREGWRCAVTDAIVTLVHDAFGIGADETAEPAWQDRALCAQTDPEAFFPEKGGSTREAKRVCRSCEVR